MSAPVQKSLDDIFDDLGSDFDEQAIDSVAAKPAHVGAYCPLPREQGEQGPVVELPVRVIDTATRLESIRVELEKKTEFVEPCKKCHGSGVFRTWGGRSLTCFTCKGKKTKTFSTSPQQRASASESATVRKERKAVSNWAAFVIAEPDVARWILNSQSFDFAASMLEAVKKYGALTEGQLRASLKCIAANEERAARKEREALARAVVVEAAPVLDAAPLEAAFARAQEAGLKSPKLRVAEFKISVAPVGGRNAGALYVKCKGEYIGKVQAGKFVKAFTCDVETEKRFLCIAVDPQAAAVAHGRATGQCAVCGLTLTNKESIERGIGPICAGKFW